MFQIDVFDKFGAILARFTFQKLLGAIAWMVKHSTGRIVSDMGTVIKEPVSWQLTRIRSQVGQPWLKGATEDYHQSRSQARRLAHQRKARVQ